MSISPLAMRAQPFLDIDRLPHINNASILIFHAVNARLGGKAGKNFGCNHRFFTPPKDAIVFADILHHFSK